MKIDSESAYCQPTLAQKPNSKSVECNNIVNDTVALEPSEKLIKEVSYGLTGKESDIKCVSSHMNRDGPWNVSEFDCSTSDDSINANEDDARDFGEADKERHDTGIKDICIDQGVTSLVTILFGDGADEGKALPNFLPSEEDIVLKPSAKEDGCKDLANQCGSVNPLQIDSPYSNITEATEEKQPREHVETEDLKPDLSCDHENGVDKQSVQVPNEEAISKKSTLVSASKESNSSSNKSIVSSAPASASAVEESKNNDIAYDRKVEDGSITFNFDSSAPKEETSQNGACVNLATQNLSKQANETVSDQIRHSPGESSFSVTGPLSGLITHSDPIAYSGSCSMRSDSSTTSTRSFAFPVLQAEWNSSPVRMRKAEKRKLKGWREGLLCCRF